MKLWNERVVVYVRQSGWPSAHHGIYLHEPLIGENLDEEVVGAEGGQERNYRPAKVSEAAIGHIKLPSPL